MDISQLASYHFNHQPLWTSVSRFTWRQKLALRWPYSEERGKQSEGLFLLGIFVFIGGFILRGLTPTGHNDMLFNFLLLAWTLVSVVPALLVHHLAQSTLREMRSDPRFRFATTQDSPGFRLASMYFDYVRYDLDAQWTPALSARVNKWLEERWGADVPVRYTSAKASSYSSPTLWRWQTLKECMESFAALRLPLPAGFKEECNALLALRQDAYVQALKEEIVMERDAFNDLRRDLATKECELDVLLSTQQLFTRNRGVDTL